MNIKCYLLGSRSGEITFLLRYTPKYKKRLSQSARAFCVFAWGYSYQRKYLWPANAPIPVLINIPMPYHVT